MASRPEYHPDPPSDRFRRPMKPPVDSAWRTGFVRPVPPCWAVPTGTRRPDPPPVTGRFARPMFEPGQRGLRLAIPLYVRQPPRAGRGRDSIRLQQSVENALGRSIRHPSSPKAVPRERSKKEPRTKQGSRGRVIYRWPGSMPGELLKEPRTK
jgi:hypothetical protein